MYELYTINDPDQLTYPILAGLRVTTLGTKFLGMSTVKFRRMLRCLGVKVYPYVSRSQDLIILGEKLSLSNRLAIAEVCDGRNCPVLAPHWIFGCRYMDAIRRFEIRRGLTVEKHLRLCGDAVPESVAKALDEDPQK